MGLGVERLLLILEKQGVLPIENALDVYIAVLAINVQGLGIGTSPSPTRIQSRCDYSIVNSKPVRSQPMSFAAKTSSR